MQLAVGDPGAFVVSCGDDLTVGRNANAVWGEEAGREHFEVSSVLSTLITVPWCSFRLSSNPRPPTAAGQLAEPEVAFAIHLEIKAKSWNEGVVFTGFTKLS